MQTDDIIDLKRLGLIVRRQKLMIGAVIAAFLCLALAYVLTAPALYTARTLVLLDRSVTQAVSDISAVKQMAFESAALESEVEVLRSRRVADQVIDMLVAKGVFKQPGDEVAREQIAGELRTGLRVDRVGETYVLSIQYTSKDPQLSADIANAYAEAYITDQLDAMAEMSTRTASWLGTQIEELGRQAIEAQQAVADYRVRYNESRRGNPQPEPVTSDAPDGVPPPSSDTGLGILRNLEKEAETYRGLYDSYLEKLETINMQQSFPVTETRVITRAVPPAYKSHPRSKLVVGAAIIFGAGIGLILAILRENFDHTLRRAGQIRRETGRPFLGFLPDRSKSGRRVLEFSSGGNRGPVEIALHGQSVAEPFSLYSDTIRTLRNALDHAEKGTEREGGKVVGVVAAQPGEGKSVVASNLALFLSQSARCVLIDADIRSSTPVVSDRKQGAVRSLADVLSGKAALSEALLNLKNGNLAVLASFAEEAGQVLPYLNAGSAGRVIEECRKEFDYVVVELPALLSPADFFSFAQTVDSFFIVAEWGKTLSNSLNFHLAQNGVDPDRILGVVLENADMKKMEKYYGHKVYA